MRHTGPEVMCKRNSPGHFRRNVRDAKGEIVRTLEFEPGVPQEIKSKADFDAIRDDIGKALVLVERDDKNHIVIVPEHDFLAEMARLEEPIDELEPADGAVDLGEFGPDDAGDKPKAKRGRAKKDG